jgi:8-oxo-dGTP pyrophosphatase MutT (NUDIX family)
MRKPAEMIHQAAAIPLRDGRVCLVMSASKRKWIIPKGHIERNETAEETAVREAWEEAGLIGSVTPNPVGSYHYEKCGQIYCVTVFLMQVIATTDQWPECGRRPRRWLPPLQAFSVVQHPELRHLLRQALLPQAEALSTL